MNNCILFFLSAALTGTAILALFNFLEQRGTQGKPLSWFGQNTIVILCTNNLLIEIIRLLDAKLTGSLLLRTRIWGSILFTIILIALELPIMKLAEGPLAPVFGRRIQKGK